MKTHLCIALLLCTALACAQTTDDPPTPTKFCTAMAAAHSIQSTMGEEEAPLTVRDYLIVAVARDRTDTVALGCITNGEVPEKVNHGVGKGIGGNAFAFGVVSI